MTSSAPRMGQAVARLRAGQLQQADDGLKAPRPT